MGRRTLIAGIQKAALDTGHQPCRADSSCWISQSCLWFEKSLSAFYRYLLITLNTPRPCLCIFEGNYTLQSKCRIEIGYQPAERSTRSCLHPLNEGCEFVLLLNWLVYSRTSIFFLSPGICGACYRWEKSTADCILNLKQVSKQEAFKYADLGNPAVKQGMFGVRVKAPIGCCAFHSRSGDSA